MAKQINIPTEARSWRSCCAVVACAAVTGRGFGIVRMQLAGMGAYSPSKGTTAWMYHKWLRRLGYELRTVFGVAGLTVAAVERELPRQGRFLVSTNGHVAAFVDGKWHDTYHARRARVHMVLQVVGEPAKQPRARKNADVHKFVAFVREATRNGHFLTVNELAAKMGVEAKKVRNWIDSARRSGYEVRNIKGRILVNG